MQVMIYRWPVVRCNARDNEINSSSVQSDNDVDRLRREVGYPDRVVVSDVARLRRTTARFAVAAADLRDCTRGLCAYRQHFHDESGEPGGCGQSRIHRGR